MHVISTVTFDDGAIVIGGTHAKTVAIEVPGAPSTTMGPTKVDKVIVLDYGVELWRGDTIVFVPWARVRQVTYARAPDPAPAEQAAPKVAELPPKPKKF